MREKFKSQYKVRSQLSLPSFLLGLVVSQERAVELAKQEGEHKPVVNAFAGATDGGKRGNGYFFHGQGVRVGARNGVFIDGTKARAVVKFMTGTEIVDRAAIEPVEYPRQAPCKERWIDSDGDIHDNQDANSPQVWKSREHLLAEPESYRWKTSWLCKCTEPCRCGWDLTLDCARRVR